MKNKKPTQLQLKKPSNSKRSSRSLSDSLFDDIYKLHYEKSVRAIHNAYAKAINDRGILTEIAAQNQFQAKLRDKLDTKFRNDKFLERARNCMRDVTSRYEHNSITTFVTAKNEPYHLPELRKEFVSGGSSTTIKSKSLKLSDVDLLKKIAEYNALEDNVDLAFARKSPVPTTNVSTLTSQTEPAQKKSSRMIVSNKALTDLVRIFESLSEARFIEKVNQELITSIFQKRMEDHSAQEWTPNQYAALKSNAFPTNRDDRPPQTSSEYMVNFVNCLLNLMSPDAKKKLNRS